MGERRSTKDFMTLDDFLASEGTLEEIEGRVLSELSAE